MKTVEIFLDELNRSNICNFNLTIQTPNRDDENKTMMELFSISRYGRNPEEKLDFYDFLQYLCNDDYDFRALKLLLDRPILDETMLGNCGSTFRLIITI